MKKRKKPYLLVAVIVTMLSIVGYVNLKSAFSGSSSPEETTNPDAPPPLQSGTEQKDDMKRALHDTMAGTSKVRISKEGGGGVKVPDRPLVVNPVPPAMRPSPSESQTGRLSDSPESRK